MKQSNENTPDVKRKAPELKMKTPDSTINTPDVNMKAPDVKKKATDMKIKSRKADTMVEGDKEELVMVKIDGEELKKRLQSIIVQLEKLLQQTRGQQRTELLTFLCAIVAEFQLEVETDFSGMDKVTIEDRLCALRYVTL